MLKLCCANYLIADYRTICDVLKLSGAHDLTADHKTKSDEHITLSTKTCSILYNYSPPSDSENSQKICAVHKIH